MKYYSTNLKAEKVNFGTALLKGLADDGGLYMPETFPVFSPDELEALKAMDYPGIAYAVLHKFLADEIPADELRRLVDDAYDFAVPLEPVDGRRFVMRLDQGPTASFKDFAARMMGRLMQHYLKKENRRLLILTATSGDTGSAIANAFYGLDNIEVVVLFPTTEVTARQRKQMTTLGRNIRVLSLDGKFDDCQALVKMAFNDRELDHLELSSANSINIGRLLPQAVYYFHAWAKLARDPGEEIILSVPSGNFGDLMGGLIAKQMGLPVHRFVVATNENDEFPLYCENGEYHVIAPSRNCISSAMNVGHPSNVARLIAMYGGVMDEKGVIHQPADLEKIRREMYAVSVTDAQTEETIRSAWRDHELVLEPHGAVAWAGLTRHLDTHAEDRDRLCVSIETAHPAKFPEKIRELLGFDPELPPSLQNLDDKEEFVSPLENDYPAFKTLLQEKYSK
ncbi:MAG: threonine synthase [Deltaproteobacteria bacterium HGW-Deltaproteobacteria-22]|nr:MAG: threonine synthase [Deltaproteobacteria bacterium HGW-Deltaproteobacteria-22]